jgi:hypothetical protein
MRTLLSRIGTRPLRRDMKFSSSVHSATWRTPTRASWILLLAQANTTQRRFDSSAGPALSDDHFTSRSMSELSIRAICCHSRLSFLERLVMTHAATEGRSSSVAKVSKLDTECMSLVHYKVIPHQRRIDSCSGLAVIVHDHLYQTLDVRVCNPPDMLPFSLPSLLGIARAVVIHAAADPYGSFCGAVQWIGGNAPMDGPGDCRGNNDHPSQLPMLYQKLVDGRRDVHVQSS